MHLSLGSSGGVWEPHWTACSGFAVTKDSYRYLLVLHNFHSGAFILRAASVSDTGEWEFTDLEGWTEKAGFSHITSVQHPLSPTDLCGAQAGGYIFAYNKTSRRFKLIEITESGEAKALRKGTLVSTWDCITSFARPDNGHLFVLLYAAESGAFSTFSIPELTLTNSGHFSKGWTDIISKIPAPNRWKSPFDADQTAEDTLRPFRFRFFCYSSVTGVTAFESVNIASKREARVKSPTPAPPDTPKGPKPRPKQKVSYERRKPNCMAISVDVGGKSCCLLYKHTPSEGGGASGVPQDLLRTQSGTTIKDAKDVLLLQKRIRCHREAWTAIEALPILPVVNAIQWRHLLCYSAATGAWWVCAICAPAPVKSLLSKKRSPTHDASQRERLFSKYMTSPSWEAEESYRYVSQTQWPGWAGTPLVPAPPAPPPPARPELVVSKSVVLKLDDGSSVALVPKRKLSVRPSTAPSRPSEASSSSPPLRPARINWDRPWLTTEKGHFGDSGASTLEERAVRLEIEENANEPEEGEEGVSRESSDYSVHSSASGGVALRGGRDAETQGVLAVLKALSKEPFYASNRYAENAFSSLMHGADAPEPAPIRDSAQKLWSSVWCHREDPPLPGTKSHQLETFVERTLAKSRKSGKPPTEERLERLATPVDNDAYRRRELRRMDGIVKRTAGSDRRYSRVCTEGKVMQRLYDEHARRQISLQKLRDQPPGPHPPASKPLPLADIVDHLFTSQVQRKEDTLRRVHELYMPQEHSRKNTPSRQEEGVQRLYEAEVRKIEAREEAVKCMLAEPLAPTKVLQEAEVAELVSRLHQTRPL